MLRFLRSGRRRRGVAVLLVLLLLSITMGLSYALVRSQNTQAAIGRNTDRRVLARQAALTGLTMAIKNMSLRSWSGVGTTFSRSLSNYESFSVSYTVGDPYLTSGTTDYDKYYAFRVTLDATGTSADPGNVTRTAIHRLRAVVQLNPEKLVDEPNRWSETDLFTLYQYSWAGGSNIAVPFRAIGPVRLGTWVNFGRDYSWANDAREEYLTSLNVPLTTTWTTTKSISSITRSGTTATVTCTGHGFSAGDLITISGATPAVYNGTFAIGNVTTNSFTYTVSSSPSTPAGGTKTATKNSSTVSGTVDWRPFNATVTLPTGWFWQESGLTDLLATITGTPCVNCSVTTYAFAPSGAPSNYRLYPGGRQYSVVTLPQDCGTQQQWKPDPTTNPAGIFARNGTVNLCDGANIQGSVYIGSGYDLNVTGKNVSLLSQNLLPLAGSPSTVVRLPIVMSGDDVRIYSGASGTLQGMAVAAGTFEITAGSQTDDVVNMQLRVAAYGISIHERTEWNQPATWWSQQYSNFKNQGSQGKIVYFPDYLLQTATPTLRPQPTLVISPDTSTPTHYHWNNLQTTIYDYPDSTRGLSWSLVRWIDNPPAPPSS